MTQKCTVDDRTVKYEIWDTAGQERFHSLAPMYYRNAQAAIVMYDITKSVGILLKCVFIHAKTFIPTFSLSLSGNSLLWIKQKAGSRNYSAKQILKL